MPNKVWIPVVYPLCYYFANVFTKNNELVSKPDNPNPKIHNAIYINGSYGPFTKLNIMLPNPVKINTTENNEVKCFLD